MSKHGAQNTGHQALAANVADQRMITEHVIQTGFHDFPNIGSVPDEILHFEDAHEAQVSCTPPIIRAVLASEAIVNFIARRD